MPQTSTKIFPQFLHRKNIQKPNYKIPAIIKPADLQKSSSFFANIKNWWNKNKKENKSKQKCLFGLNKVKKPSGEIIKKWKCNKLMGHSGKHRSSTGKEWE
jgi:hypothetical protein